VPANAGLLLAHNTTETTLFASAVQVHFVVGDGLDLPPAVGSADVVLSFESACYMPDKRYEQILAQSSCRTSCSAYTSSCVTFLHTLHHHVFKTFVEPVVPNRLL
jgi:hypothetical protein